MRRIQPIPDEWMAEAQQKLSDFIKRRSSSVVWKTFEIRRAESSLKKQLTAAGYVQRRLLDILTCVVRVPCVVCQDHLGVIFCRLTYKKVPTHLPGQPFKPCVYLVIYPRQTLIFSSRGQLDDVITDALIRLYGAPHTTAEVAAAQSAARQREESLKQLNKLKHSADEKKSLRCSARILSRKMAALEAAAGRPISGAELSLRKLPLTGRGFRSLHQLHHRKLCWQRIQDSHPPRLKLVDFQPCPVCVQLD